MAEYFSQLEALSQAFGSNLQALDEQAGAEFDATESEDEAIEVFVTFVGEMRSNTDAFIGEIDALSAPAEATAAHNEAVTAGQELVDMWDNALAVLDTVETFEDATLVLEGPGFVDADNRFSAACGGLQGVADANGIEADLDCPGGR